jgi:hypothetical protein
MRAAVNVKHFPRDKCCIVEVHHRINDLIDFAHPADRLKTLQKVMGFHFVHRCSYGSESDRVDAYALTCRQDTACESTSSNEDRTPPERQTLTPRNQYCRAVSKSPKW